MKSPKREEKVTVAEPSIKRRSHQTPERFKTKEKKRHQDFATKGFEWDQDMPEERHKRPRFNTRPTEAESRDISEDAYNAVPRRRFASLDESPQNRRNDSRGDNRYKGKAPESRAVSQDMSMDTPWEEPQEERIRRPRFTPRPDARGARNTKSFGAPKERSPREHGPREDGPRERAYDNAKPRSKYASKEQSPREHSYDAAKPRSKYAPKAYSSSETNRWHEKKSENRPNKATPFRTAPTDDSRGEIQRSVENAPV